MKVLFCSSEVVPFAKTGGLADVCGALPLALERLGCEIKVALPKYRCVQIKGKTARLGEAIDVYLIENERFFDRLGLYGEDGRDYPDNLERFAFFCRRTLHLLKANNFQPEIIHCHDWQTALIPVYLQTVFKEDAYFSHTKTVFTIHNLAYQGIFPGDKFMHTGLKESLLDKQQLEFYGQVNLLKGGIIFSNFLTTVSPTYAREIQTHTFGCGLDSLLRKRNHNLLGILNGLDYALWNPATDKMIFQRYTRENLGDKYINKERLQKELNLPAEQDIPLVGMIGRLTAQKGIELIIAALAELSRLNLQFILLGTGEAKYEHSLSRIKQKGYPNISINLRFDPLLAHKIYAGCDMLLMPSQFEPCGLGQLIAFKYGTIPIVHKTGGLADTVFDYQPHRETGNGFVFVRFSNREMLRAIKRALALYRQKDKWRRLMLKVMDYDFSWNSPAQKYLQLYRQLLEEG